MVAGEAWPEHQRRVPCPRLLRKDTVAPSMKYRAAFAEGKVWVSPTSAASSASSLRTRARWARDSKARSQSRAGACTLGLKRSAEGEGGSRLTSWALESLRSRAAWNILAGQRRRVTAGESSCSIAVGLLSAALTGEPHGSTRQHHISNMSAHVSTIEQHVSTPKHP
jgi:hypothetical protein